MKNAAIALSAVLAGYFLTGFVHFKMMHPSSQIENGFSVLYDGSDDYVTIGQPADLEWDPDAKEGTISLWAKLNDLAFQRIILGKAQMSSDNVSYVMGFLSTSGSPYAVVGDGNNGSGTMLVDEWNHLVTTVRNVGGTHTLFLFKNGVQVGTAAAGSDQNTTHDWIIGGARWDTNASLGYQYSGHIDEVTFWDAAFTDADVGALYNLGRATNPVIHGKANTLLHWYRMGDGPGDSYPTINDQVGTADGTMTNMAGAGNFEATYPGEPPAPSGPTWSNDYSCKYAGTATATAGRTNFGQPTDWCVNLAANARSFSWWFRSNTGAGQDASGALLTSADQSSNSHFRTGTSGTAVNNNYAGGQFIFTSCSATVTANTWTLITVAFDGSTGVKMYVGNTSTSCIGAFTGVGTQLCTRDFIFNTLRSTTNADTAFGEWGTPNLDELTVWNAELSGTDHQALIDGSGRAVDPSTHAHAADLTAYYRCGDDPSDSSTTLNDQIGSWDGTHSGTDGVTYQTDVP